MTKPRYIRFNVNLLPGPITDPQTGAHPFIDIDAYVVSAKLAESALLDSVFLADALAVAPDPRAGFNWALDPLTILPAIARETTSIGLLASASTTYGNPYALARAILSIDHISKGRAGWNIVTTMEPSAARNFGVADYPDRGARYRRAAEFAQVVVALWHSWKGDLSQPWDAGNLDYAPIAHQGEFFSVHGPLQLPASRQGLPVIYQAGGSDEGLEVAASFADGVFTVGVEEVASAAYRSRLNQRSRQLRGKDVQVMPGLGLTVGSTEEEVERLIRQAEDAVDHRRLQRIASRYKLDPAGLDLDQPVPAELLQFDADTISVGFAQGGVDLARAKPITLRRFIILGGGGHRRLFGTPESVADDLVGWVDRGAADGFNLSVPDLPPFVEHIVPILQERGLYRRAYTGTTLREHIQQNEG